MQKHNTSMLRSPIKLTGQSPTQNMSYEKIISLQVNGIKQPVFGTKKQSMYSVDSSLPAET